MDSLTLFCSLAAALVLEAAPFLLLGALVSALLEEFVPKERLARVFPRSLAGGVGLGLVAGFVLPTCECGVVAVTRRLMLKGVPGPAAVTYMLAAPVVNPVVLASTYFAFLGNGWFVAARAGVVLAAALTMGLALLKVPTSALVRAGTLCGQTDDTLTPLAPGLTRRPGARLMRVARLTLGEFTDMGAYLVAGALVAALFKTFPPTDLVLTLRESLPLSVGGMMLLAMLLSICSEADAFVAASFVNLPAAARVAFTAIGPMVDVKLLVMFQAVFAPRLVLALAVVPTFLVFWLCCLGGWLYG